MSDVKVFNEKKYDLPAWREYKDEVSEDKPYEIEEEIDWEKRVKNRLSLMTKERTVNLEVLLKFWEAFDIIMVNNKEDKDKIGRAHV